jgi:hypothetical protein
VEAEYYESDSSVEADEDTDTKVGGDAETGPEAGSAAQKYKLEDELAKEKHRTHEANAQFNALTIAKVEILCC